MKLLILGATGATGRLAVQQMVNRNIEVKIVVRNLEKLPIELRNSDLVDSLVGNITEFSAEDFEKLLLDCDAIVSCLGHNITFKGIFGKPHMLVTNTVINICKAAIKSKKNKVRIILMNTTAIRNKKIEEKYPFIDKLVLSILGFLLPPQKDNEKAAQYLYETIGNDNTKIQWVAVRPDTLVNNEKESPYELCESPKRSPVFNSGKTSRINVSRFMAELIVNEDLWEEWKNKMPVIYNKD